MTDTAPLIRPSEDRDLPAITAIYGHHVRFGTASFEFDPPSLADMTRRRAEILAKGQPYFVAEDRGSVLGYAYAGTYRPRPGYRATVEDSIYIRPDIIGRGIGGHLLPVLVAACEARDYRQIIAVIGDSDNLASIRLHERCGFQRVGIFRAVGYKLGRWLDSVLLQRSLGRGDSTPPAAP